MTQASALFDGVLFFPVTPFWPDGELHPQRLAEHISERLDDRPGAVFVACGTGEFSALSLSEYHDAVSAAVRATRGQVPVFAGAGGTWATAREQVRAARTAGADGVLLMPPYLVRASQSGLLDYVRAVTSEAGLPVVVYSRDNAVFTVASAVELTTIPGVIGLKDGSGDIETVALTVSAVRRAIDESADPNRPFTFFNGLPTAEVTVPAYRAVGVDQWSSAVFAFAPEVATAFHRAITTGDLATVQWLLADFYHPLVTVRRRVSGYAVALVKAMVRVRGLDVGPVRPPLVEPGPADLAEVEALTASALAKLRRFTVVGS
jgi:5-dehydro-4-deoxyglucarate dehydratase